MFILRRKAQEVIVVDGRITITVHRIEGNRVALAFDAPRDVPICRGEQSDHRQSVPLKRFMPNRKAG